MFSVEKGIPSFANEISRVSLVSLESSCTPEKKQIDTSGRAFVATLMVTSLKSRRIAGVDPRCGGGTLTTNTSQAPSVRSESDLCASQRSTTRSGEWSR